MFTLLLGAPMTTLVWVVALPFVTVNGPTVCGPVTVIVQLIDEIVNVITHPAGSVITTVGGGPASNVTEMPFGGSHPAPTLTSAVRKNALQLFAAP